ncbi:hypothetical protein BKA62DRAFT_318844 [Auriculariales sp. MPI-PUGE-AT-0066]|nr:hypothetical protein BKA62DRAFT_318844 [Auriculariales sp. MPI-PUGE-AT-0066]
MGKRHRVRGIRGKTQSSMEDCRGGPHKWHARRCKCRKRFSLFELEDEHASQETPRRFGQQWQKVSSKHARAVKRSDSRYRNSLLATARVNPRIERYLERYIRGRSSMAPNLRVWPQQDIELKNRIAQSECRASCRRCSLPAFPQPTCLSRCTEHRGNVGKSSPIGEEGRSLFTRRLPIYGLRFHGLTTVRRPPPVCPRACTPARRPHLQPAFFTIHALYKCSHRPRRHARPWPDVYEWLSSAGDVLPCLRLVVVCNIASRVTSRNTSAICTPPVKWLECA